MGRPGDSDARLEQALESGKERVLQIDPERQDAIERLRDRWQLQRLLRDNQDAKGAAIRMRMRCRMRDGRRA